MILINAFIIFWTTVKNNETKAVLLQLKIDVIDMKLEVSISLWIRGLCLFCQNIWFPN